MTSKPFLESKKARMAAGGICAVLLVVVLAAFAPAVGQVGSSAILTIGGIVSVYCGGQAFVDSRPSG